MLVYSDHQLEQYQVIGPTLRIHWNFQEIPETEERSSHWICEEAVVSTNADRGTIISTIIRSRYTIDAEFAAINNGGEDHQKLLDFRVQAKSLANGWVNRSQT